MDSTVVLKALAAANPENRNVVISVYSISILLSMVARGADGKTRDEMAQTIFGVAAHELDASIARLAEESRYLTAEKRSEVELHLANAIWVNKALASGISREYTDAVRRDFGAPVEADKAFSDTSVVDDINNWAAAHTSNLVPEVVDQNDLSPNCVAVLLNALYFKGAWAVKFEQAKTVNAPFRGDSGAVSEVKMMRRQFSADDNLTFFAGNGTFEAFSLMFGQPSDNARIVFVRPKNDKTTARQWLDEHGGSVSWLELHTYYKAVGWIGVPHISIKQRHNLNSVMRGLGLKTAFGSGADFSKMSTAKTKDFHIGIITQDVVFAVDESGSTAAAVTKCTLRCMGPRHGPPEVNVQLDRSFVFAVVVSGLPLVVGIVDDPASK